jgi:hypothetical protein
MHGDAEDLFLKEITSYKYKHKKYHPKQTNTQKANKSG